ncbi:alpha/beta fold hydrolase [Aquibium carbonis]|uniref:Alpha/beta fold hydrolase n=1 Tax=Aquibium carbonis TaxID=2495581 RepID=A0A429YTN0_9HYPH|nr:alpha/beta fold hydrolase [Aquibium carbonis]
MDRPDWNREGRDWPNRTASRFVSAARMRWHVQIMGEGPALLLLHGTGSATHSWRDLLPLLAENFTVVAPDLPGHGFTAMPPPAGLSLRGMAVRVAALLAELQIEPAIVVGHSAGAAIAAQMAIDSLCSPGLIVSINGALKPIRRAGLFSPLAKLLFLNPLAPRLFSWRARAPGATLRLLENTGSRIDVRGVALYERLFQSSGHVEATLGMMASWNLDDMPDRLRRLETTLLFVAAAGDKAVPPSDATEFAMMVRNGETLRLPRGGHLAHEEVPGEFAALLVRVATGHGIL